MLFHDRERAGAALAETVASRLQGQRCRVYGLARGGVVVARPVAERLGASLEVLVACKVGSPDQPELAVGAVAEGGGEYWDPWNLHLLGLDRDWCATAVRAAREEVARRVGRYRGHSPIPEEGEIALVVDDGIATGSTVIAALRGLAALGASRRAVATPVASHEALALIEPEAEWIAVLHVPASFGAVSSFYNAFEPVEDEELKRALGMAA